MGALLIALMRDALSLERLREVMRSTLRISSMVFLILIGASFFSLVFRGYGGDDGVRAILEALPGGVFGAMLLVMLVCLASSWTLSRLLSSLFRLWVPYFSPWAWIPFGLG
jgi:TRAP-type mannitol/chloroaromatic compound transport system permease large subunit